MFTVNIKDKIDTTYYVFNKGELYQPIIPIGAHFAIDKDKYELEDIMTQENGIVVIIKNRKPVIISSDDYEKFINNTTGILSRWEEAPTTEITDRVYDILHKLYQVQYKETEKYKKEQAIGEDVNIAEKQLYKQKGPYRTF